MTGVLLGLMLGVGAACIWWSFWPRTERSTSARRRTPFRVLLADEIALAGLRGLSPAGLLATAVVLALLTGLLTYAVTAVPAIAVAFGVMAGYAPVAFVRMRARARRAQLREVWPDVVDHVASAVRAGLALPEALVQLAERGPEELRPAFAHFADDYRASGRFSQSLDALKDRLADPVADRLVEALRLAREVGGSDLGRVLRALSQFLREDARSRAELEARQSWTVNAARLAMAAPWLVLALMATRSSSLVAYREPTGIVILLVGAALSLLAYRLMVVLGRLPEEERVLR
ncbi:MAG TPA: type II secretion system F family protein [Ornithinimicrobium sp.]|uniref:type II secretion system F family protein n=1 Tax=Ornithinimicrobium sp. TaxID=1977084 RepID=UPI002B4A3EE7|nr:type II secretion system F family protein [Ornithinimicrobium sp.]HKJ11230.1 type II secretion system F family protein [Ornithinimicrobium sp.]